MVSLSMKYIIACIVGFLILGVALSATYAENDYFALGQGSQKFEPKADHLSMLPEHWIWEGNVKVIQGNITLTCDKLITVFESKEGPAPKGGRKSPGNIKSITASGNVKIVQDDRMATAGKAFFDGVNRTITLTDGPRIWQGRDEGIANAIVMYPDENRWEFQGEDDKPIKFTIRPGQLKNGQKKESPQKKN
jgi:lipopolysaccharide export system protein LptA